MALSLVVAQDIVDATLTFYTRGKVFEQTMQERPLLRILRDKQKTFPGGKDNISDPVQGAHMSDVPGFLAGYTEADALAFTQAENIKRAYVPWKEVFAGLVISMTELKKDGVTVTDGQKTKEHSDADLVRLTGLLQNRLEDFGESWARDFNEMLWRDGSQDSKAVPGVLSILTDSAAVGTTAGLDRAAYAWWRHRVLLNITPSAASQTLSKTLRSELRQLRRYMGKPDVALCGSAFIEALELEVQEKGLYTQEGFKSEGKTDLGMADISMRGLGKFTYDPTLDDLGLTKRCYIVDSRRLLLRPMEGEENKVTVPERPYDQMVFLRGMTWTGGLSVTQLNCHGVYSVA